MKLVFLFVFYFVVNTECHLQQPSACTATNPESSDKRNHQVLDSSAENLEENAIRATGLTSKDEERLMRNCTDRSSSYRRYSYDKLFRDPTAIKYKIENYTPDLKRCEVRNIFKKAFRFWEEAGEVTFVEAAENEKEDMRISFAYGKHGDRCDAFDGPNNWLAHAWPGGNIHFDEAEQWCTDNNMTVQRAFDGTADGHDCVFPFVYKGKQYNSCTMEGSNDGDFWCSTTANYDRDRMYGFCDGVASLLQVGVHEIGHTLGFNHSYNCLSVMYDSYRHVNDYALHNVDIQGMVDVYGARTSPLPPLQLEPCGENEVEDKNENENKKGSDTQEEKEEEKEQEKEQEKAEEKAEENEEEKEEEKEEKKEESKKTISSRKIQKLEDICELTKYKAELPYGDPIRFELRFNESSIWRQDYNASLEYGPYLIQNIWEYGPDKVDAVYSRSYDGRVFLFRGQQYWAYTSIYRKRLLSGYPKPITNLGFPSHVQKVDAAINWKRSRKSQNKWTTFFVGEEFYSYNELKSKMHKGNPGQIELWNSTLGVVTKAMDHPNHARKAVLFVGDKAFIMKNNYQKNVKRSPEEIVNC